MTVCGWCSGPPGAKVPHCKGKRWDLCQCPCAHRRKAKKAKD